VSRSDDSSTGLRIAIVSDGIGDVIAGSFISTRRFAERLHARGNQVVFLSSGRLGQPREDTLCGMPVHRLPGVLIPWSDRQLYLAVPSLGRIRRVLADVDVVHIMIPMPLGLAAARVAKSLAKPIVMHSHTQPENIFMNVPPFPGFKALHERFCAYVNWLYRQADVRIYPSEFSRRQFPELIDLPNVVISNGVDRERFRPTCPDAFMQRFNLSKGRRHLLYLGRLHREKNVETLIRALPGIVHRHPDVHLVVVGLGYERPMLEALARRERVEAHVTFCGFVADEDLPAAYAVGDVFVLPSLAELEGMVILEAMACGKPLLIADSPNSAATEFVNHNGLLFTAKNPEHLAERVDRLLADPHRLRAMGTRSLEESRRFDIRDSVRQIESVYRSLVPAQ
jgi:glycosyltransferase involved in cell wall biosynthesis